MQMRLRDDAKGTCVHRYGGRERLEYLEAEPPAFPAADGTAERMLVAINLTGRHAALPKPVADLLADGVSEDRIILSTYDAIHSAKSLANGELAGWEGVVVEL